MLTMSIYCSKKKKTMSIYEAGPTHANHPYHLPFSEENDFLDSDFQYYRYTIRYIIQFFDVKLIICVGSFVCVCAWV